MRDHLGKLRLKFRIGQRDAWRFLRRNVIVIVVITVRHTGVRFAKGRGKDSVLRADYEGSRCNTSVQTIKYISANRTMTSTSDMART